MRALSLLLALAAAGCSLGGEEVEGDPIACALAGSADLADDCRLERTSLDGAELFIVRHPDGGFHRLRLSADGQRVEPADGADLSQSARKGEVWEVMLGDNRYVIPVRADAAAQ